jgi:predicted transcriptional regulator
LDYVKGRGCALTSDVAAALGISGDRAYHALQALTTRGDLCVVKSGFNIWCIPGAAVDPFTAAAPCLAEVRNVLGEIAEAARGGVVSIAPGQLARELARRCRMPPSFSLLIMVNSYLSHLFTDAERTKTRYIMTRSELLSLVRNFPEVRPPCVDDQRRAASRSGMVTVAFKLSRGVLAEVDRLAESLGMRRSDLIRRAIEEYLEERLRARNAAPPQATAQEAGNAQDGDEDFPVIKGRI